MYLKLERANIVYCKVYYSLARDQPKYENRYSYIGRTVHDDRGSMTDGYEVEQSKIGNQASLEATVSLGLILTPVVLPEA